MCLNMALAAIHNGANAIYVGMPGFNARGRSHDHSLEELEEIIQICHLYDVHVHVAFNILIFQSELEQVPGIGTKTADKLLRHFKSVSKILSVNSVSGFKITKYFPLANRTPSAFPSPYPKFLFNVIV